MLAEQLDDALIVVDDQDASLAGGGHRPRRMSAS
jgi:hypothetical protein